MRAFLLESFDGPDALRLTTTAEPSPGEDGVVVRVRAVGVNFPDLLTTRGKLADLPSLPTIPGREIAGVVEHAPRDSAWRPGDRVAAYIDHGGYAEAVEVPLDRVMALPASADFAAGAALVVNYQTAYFALTTRGRLASGETVLVLGAAGGIGTAAVQVAGASGARVIAGVANEEQAETALSAGAGDAVVLATGFAAKVRALSGEGVDVVVDPLGGDVSLEALRCLRPEGRHLVVGFVAGGVPALPANRLLMRNLEAIGVSWTGPMRAPGPGFADVGRILAEMYERNLLRPQIGARYALTDLPFALSQLEQGAVHGKAIVEIG
ncbi:zinc-binding dehydrogenase [Amycolatopsis pigmentata]|uniref:Zinc-binding dehydrogenase n=1 Tax=Amycolatopsis pigmentata TaxID=450801 RepID=A0ABW5G5G4_9PSEU